MKLPTSTGKQFCAGFAYLSLLTMISASLIMLVVAMPDLYQKQQRQQETQFLFIVNQYLRAIESYYNHKDLVIREYPADLEALLIDNRSLRPTHHLRKLYSDPLSNKEWGLIKNEQQQIIGIFSQSNRLVIRSTLFSKFIVSDEDETSRSVRHSDLHFIFEPSQSNDSELPAQPDIELLF